MKSLNKAIDEVWGEPKEALKNWLFTLLAYIVIAMLISNFSELTFMELFVPMLLGFVVYLIGTFVIKQAKKSNAKSSRE